MQQLQAFANKRIIHISWRVLRLLHAKRCSFIINRESKDVDDKEHDQDQGQDQDKVVYALFMAEFEIEFDAVYLSCLVGTAGGGEWRELKT